MDAAERLLTETIAAWGLSLDAQQLELLDRYAQELARWNQHTNLTAVTGREEIYRRHFLDAFSLAQFWGEPPASLVDIGSGGGFPGLPLKILQPTLELILVDSVGKKTDFLSHIVRRLDLTGVRVRTARAEELGRDPAERERHALVTARAVADLRVLAEYALPLLRVGGRLLAPKGAAAYDEAAAATQAIDLLGGELIGVEPVSLPGLDPRAVIVVQKIAPTDRRYPRAVGMPARRPL